MEERRDKRELRNHGGNSFELNNEGKTSDASRAAKRDQREEEEEEEATRDVETKRLKTSWRRFDLNTRKRLELKAWVVLFKWILFGVCDLMEEDSRVSRRTKLSYEFSFSFFFFFH